MESIFRKVRIKFLYVGTASALMSVVLLYAGYRITAFLYRAGLHTADSSYVKLINWIINHIGKLPAAMLTGSALFLAIFFWRSGKIRSDLEELCREHAEAALMVEAANDEAEEDEQSDIPAVYVHSFKGLH
ncbi:hypothetical protein [Paenibacillus nasutitermitis]|uniref:Uncharacterized protein n=1 Tax=Paenibacillus nasutitermitis TaxID=1652958 RepID=A0A916Z5G6_9BACL|nr:hypothetical protein [Paenibacillus nasutitermitis]GGD77332.1 hypothetical protein GCM10010911_39190 [Paenibacillus nasutitermitis]